jgi:hypothetical protein
VKKKVEGMIREKERMEVWLLRYDAALHRHTCCLLLSLLPKKQRSLIDEPAKETGVLVPKPRESGQLDAACTNMGLRLTF